MKDLINKKTDELEALLENKKIKGYFQGYIVKTENFYKVKEDYSLVLDLEISKNHFTIIGKTDIFFTKNKERKNLLKRELINIIQEALEMQSMGNGRKFAFANMHYFIINKTFYYDKNLLLTEQEGFKMVEPILKKNDIPVLRKKDFTYFNEYEEIFKDDFLKVGDTKLINLIYIARYRIMNAFADSLNFNQE